MIDAFLDSIEPPVSDSEDEQFPKPAIQHLRVSTVRKVKTLLVACKPLTAVFEHLCGDEEIVLAGDSQKAGRAGVSGPVGVLCLEREVRFDPRSVFDFDQIFVLVSKQGRLGVRCIASYNQSSLPAYTDAVSGMAACLLTQSLMTKTNNCSVIVVEHESIHPQLNDAMELWAALSKTLNLPTDFQSSIATAFKQAVPLNRKVPLYT